MPYTQAHPCGFRLEALASEVASCPASSNSPTSIRALRHCEQVVAMPEFLAQNCNMPAYLHAAAELPPDGDTMVLYPGWAFQARNRVVSRCPKQVQSADHSIKIAAGQVVDWTLVHPPYSDSRQLEFSCEAAAIVEETRVGDTPEWATMEPQQK